MHNKEIQGKKISKTKLSFRCKENEQQRSMFICFMLCTAFTDSGYNIKQLYQYLVETTIFCKKCELYFAEKLVHPDL